MIKRTLFILRVPPPFGGGEIVSEELFIQLKDHYDFYLIKQKKHSKSTQANPSIRSVLFGIKLIFNVIKKIYLIKPDVIYLSLSKGFAPFVRNSIIILYAKSKGIEIIGELHGMSFPFIIHCLKRRYFYYIMKKIKKIRVLGNSVKQYLIDIGLDSNIFVIPNGISRPRNFLSNNEAKSNKINFLYLGCISNKKGFGRVLEVFSNILQSSMINWHLNIIGEWVNKKEKSDYLYKINNSELKNFLTFHGRKVSSEKWKLIIKNDILIHLTEFDGQPLTILETMSLGIPTLATKVGAIPETIIDKKTGFLVNNLTEAESIIKKILHAEFDFNSIYQNCIRNYNNNFTTEIMAKNIQIMCNDN